MHLHDEIVDSASSGLKIFRRIVTPAHSEIRGVFLMLHGLGDHQGCHIEAAEMFARHGFASVGIDWPGNGNSEGVRGDVPGVETALDLIDEHLALIPAQFGAQPLGVYAHSTGGFLILRYLTLRKRNPFRWVWLSSPLLDPRHGKAAWLKAIAPFLAKIFPKFTIPSGVTLEHIRHIDPANPKPGTHRIEGRHGKVSVRFGVDLLQHSKDIEKAGAYIKAPTEVLITQGSEDALCPPEFSHALFEKIATPEKNYVLLHGLRHELFREPANDEFVEVVDTWVSDLTSAVD